MSHSVRIGLSLAISAVFLFFAARGVDWNEAAAALAGANYFYVAPMIAVTVWTLYVRAQRWRVLLHPLGTPAMRNLVAATNIGFMANMVLPLRVGEVIRPVMLSRTEKLPLGGIMATIILERVADLLTVVVLFALSVALVDVSGTVEHWATVQQTSYWLCGFALLLVGGLLFVRWQEKWALQILQLVLRPFPHRLADPVTGFFKGFVHALKTLDSPSAVARFIGWSLFLWLLITSIYTLAILAFALPIPLIVGSIVLTAITAIAVSAPSAPGYIGTFQIGCTLALGLFGVAKSEALAFSFVVHLTQFVAVVGAGLYSLARGGTGGTSLRQLTEVSESDADKA